MKISVCVISYNQVRYIDECLSSILNQNLADNIQLEVIIFDDCSQDGTWDVIQDLSNHDERVIANRNSQNVGMMKNFYSALNCCTGDYIAICEGDDFWSDSNKLQSQLDLFVESKGIGLVVSSALECIDNKKNNNVLFNKGSETKRFRLNDILNHSGQFSPTASYFFSRQLIDILPTWFNIATVGDLFIEIYSTKLGDILYMPESTCYYRTLSLGSWSYNARKFNYKDKLTRSIGLYSNLISCQKDFNDERHFFDRKLSEAKVAQAECYLMLNDYSNFFIEIVNAFNLFFPTSRSHIVLYRLRNFPALAKFYVNIKSHLLSR